MDLAEQLQASILFGQIQELPVEPLIAPALQLQNEPPVLEAPAVNVAEHIPIAPDGQVGMTGSHAQFYSV
ncbi:hypothetical protein FRC07_005408 [Ceratobasidium sp. 392]|nr:hypothetical protein FRC07_005408 [Ceratobasidium sp. 392]